MMTLKSDRNLTNELSWPKNIILDANSKDFTRKQSINPFNTNINPFNKTNNLDFTDSKMEKKFTYDYQH